jgi:predicted DNA-binding transcriptional regulator AlpA
MAHRTAALIAADPIPDRTGDELLTMPEIAELTKLPEGTLRYFRHMGRGPRLEKHGRRLRGWRSDVLAWLETSDTV